MSNLVAIMVAMATVMSEKAAGWQPACCSSPQVRLLTCPESSSTRLDEAPERQSPSKNGAECMLPHGGEASRVTMLKGFAQALRPLGTWGVTVGCMRSSRSGARVEEERSLQMGHACS